MNFFEEAIMEIKKVGVLGCGLMGSGIAQVCAMAGFDVTVLEASPRIGGKLRIDEIAGVPIDVGAEAVLTVRPEGVSLMERVRPGGLRHRH